MNWKVVTIGAGCLAAAAVKLINDAANKHYRNVSEAKAKNDISSDTIGEIQDAEDMLKMAEDVTKREHKEIYDGIKNWKRDQDYDFRIKGARDFKVSELENQKLAINYYVRKNEIDEAHDSELEAFKESIDFDYEMDLNEGIIEDAEEAYKNRCRKIEKASGGDNDISDALRDLKNTEKEKRDAAIKDAKAKIAELKQKVGAEETRLNRKRQAELKTLESELQPIKLRLEKEETEVCNKINAERMKAEEDIRAAVKSKRTKKEQIAIDSQDEYRRYLDDQKSIEEQHALAIYESASISEKWGVYLKNAKCPRWVVAFLGALPLVPVGFAIERYVKFIFDVIKAM